MLEMRKLLDDVERMSEEMIRRSQTNANRSRDAFQDLQRYAKVDEPLLDKIKMAARVDRSWRGAMPLASRLDSGHYPIADPIDATLIGSDGSQIYPDRHGPALYFLVNTGTIVLRQGSAEVPQIRTQPRLYYLEEELYNEFGELVDNRRVNALREDAELQSLVQWVQVLGENGTAKGTIALKDGPLLIWMGERDTSDADRARILAYIENLTKIQEAGAVAIGYVARPRSAFVIRMLHVAGLAPSEITQESVRQSQYSVTDRGLFSKLLGPNERSAVFVSTTRLNYSEQYEDDGSLNGIFTRKGQQIAFFYLNVARKPGSEEAEIARIDVPTWVLGDTTLLDQMQHAIYRDCEGLSYPYVLTRADELARVTFQEKDDLDNTLQIALMRKGLLTAPSRKSAAKNLY